MRYRPKRIKKGMEIIGENTNNKNKLYSGQYQYPSLIENARINTENKANKSTNKNISCFLNRERLSILLINTGF